MTIDCFAARAPRGDVQSEHSRDPLALPTLRAVAFRRSKLRLLLLVGLVWIIPQSASAQTPSDCQAIADRNARLGCYDKLLPPIKRQLDAISNDTDHPKTDAPTPSNSKTTMEYSWANVMSCKTISRAPAFKFFNVPENAHSVSLVLTQGEREFGGQEVILPANGLVPEGTITMRGPCVPGIYRWTATIKSATGGILATVRADRWFPEN